MRRADQEGFVVGVEPIKKGLLWAWSRSRRAVKAAPLSKGGAAADGDGMHFRLILDIMYANSVVPSDGIL
jgi:hypothetical protein